MRVDIYTANEQKVVDAINGIRNESGQQLTPNRFVNLILEHVDAIEFTQTLIFTLKRDPEAGKGEFPRTKAPRKLKKTTNWATRL